MKYNLRVYTKYHYKYLVFLIISVRFLSSADVVNLPMNRKLTSKSGCCCSLDAPLLTVTALQAAIVDLFF